MAENMSMSEYFTRFGLSFMLKFGEFTKALATVDYDEMGITPLKTKEDTMAEAGTKVKKPRVAKAPEKIKIAVLVISGGDVVKFYKLCEKGGLMATYRRAQFQQELFAQEGQQVLPGDQVAIDTSNILYPTLTILRDEPVKAKVARKPRTPKVADDSAAPKAPRKPRTPKA